MFLSKAKKILSITLLICAIVGVINVVPAYAQSEEGVYLYQHADYNGEWIRIDSNDNVYNRCGERLGNANDLSDLFNDRISSLIIVGNYQVTLYQHWLNNRTEDGKSCLFNKNTRYIGDAYEMNDCVSSAHVEHLNSVGIYVYTGKNLSGRCMHLLGPAYDLGRYGFNNDISSIKYIGDKWHTSAYVDLYANSNLQGYLGKSTFNVTQSGNWTQYTNLASCNDVVSSCNPHF